MLGLAHEILGEEGLAWAWRLQLVHAGLRDQGGFPARVAGYLGNKYGHLAPRAEGYGGRVAALLGMLAARLRSQQAAGSGYLMGKTLTAADLYCAAPMAVFSPLPADVCAMDPTMRIAFETLDEQTVAALDPILFEHRDRIYREHLALPLSL